MNQITKIFTVLTVITLLSTIQANAFSLSDVAKGVAGKMAINKTSETISGGDKVKQDVTTLTPAQVASANPIVSTPLSVTLETAKGSIKLFSKRPKVALAGYNIGAFQTAEISGSTSRGQGASASMNIILEGVDAEMLQRIADAAQDDLVVQLQAANIEVIDAQTLFQSAESNEIKRSSEPVNGKQMDGRAPKKLIMVGPSNIGAVRMFSLVPKGFNGNIGDQASAALDAVVIYPNLALDFAWTSGGGQSMLKKSVSVEGGVRFALDSFSNFYAIYSKDGRFVDSAVTLQLKEDVGVDDIFARVELTDSKNNSGAVGISNALGFGMHSKKGNNYLVTVDPQRYEALALNAAKGFNSALVQQIKLAKGL
ncbi:MAG: hypothetical protein K9K86_05025 [Pseudomonadales bacterium]|nr:hypothetical protein [Pseudomonadales bacterium]